MLRRWRAIADAYQPPRVLIGETWVRDLPELASYYGEGTELHLAFNFAFATAPFEASALRTVIDATERALGTDPWPLWTASNHDIGRLATRWARGRRAPGAVRPVRAAAAPRDTGAVRRRRDRPPDVEIPAARRRDEGSGPGGRSRDRAARRCPGSRGPAGVHRPGVEPWLPIGGGTSVQEQRDDARSVLQWCRRLIGAARSGGPARGGQGLLDARTRARMATRGEDRRRSEPLPGDGASGLGRHGRAGDRGIA